MLHAGMEVELSFLVSVILLLSFAFTQKTTFENRQEDISTQGLLGASSGNGSEIPWSSYCITELGCLNLTSEWFDPLYRPLNLIPWDRHRINTKFSLFTRKTPPTNSSYVFIYANDTRTIRSSAFNASLPIKLIVHGFRNTGYESVFQVLAKNLLIQGDYNVVLTHWGSGAGIVNYVQVTANTRVVGLEIAYLVNTLVSEFNVRAKDVHLIGHSLGAHISGYAGQNVEGLGKITGLDPAGPWFTGTHPKVRLDPTDALFVEAIHTNAGIEGLANPIVSMGNMIVNLAGGTFGFGTGDLLGHLDFFPNGGVRQPGCDSLLSVPMIDWLNVTTDILVLGCSHERATELYSDSLISRCRFTGYDCPSYGAFKKGRCVSCGKDNTRCAPFGLHSHTYPTRSRVNVTLYFDTSPTSPFCRFHYGLKVTTAAPGWPARQVNGILSMHHISGIGGSIFNVPLSNSFTSGRAAKYDQGKEYDFLMTTFVDLRPVESVTLGWHYIWNAYDLSTYCTFFSCSSKLHVSNVTITALNIYPERNRLAYTATLCPKTSTSYVGIGSRSTADFNVNYCRNRSNLH